MKELIITDDLRERFFENVLIVPYDKGCWLWTGGKSEIGYGMFCQGKRGTHIRAHRASWIIHQGFIPDNLLVCHHCDVRNCVNPDHLFLGTKLDNAQDALKKGRLGAQVETIKRLWGTDSFRKKWTGQNHPRSKLTTEQVLQIRKMYKPNICSTGMIASQFGISQSTVHLIVTRQTWKHLPAS